jgi:hypothetical protein
MHGRPAPARPPLKAREPLVNEAIELERLKLILDGT